MSNGRREPITTLGLSVANFRLLGVVIGPFAISSLELEAR